MSQNKPNWDHLLKHLIREEGSIVKQVFKASEDVFKTFLGSGTIENTPLKYREEDHD